MVMGRAPQPLSPCPIHNTTYRASPDERVVEFGPTTEVVDPLIGTAGFEPVGLDGLFRLTTPFR